LGVGSAPGDARPSVALALVAFVVILSQVAVGALLTFPLWVGSLCLLLEDARAPRKATLWLIPISVLWANLHGSVLLLPSLMAVLGVARAFDGLRAGQPGTVRGLARDALLAVALLGAVFASPYAPGLPGYYASTVGNPMLQQYVTE
jgi:hypothetical protein